MSDNTHILDATPRSLVSSFVGYASGEETAPELLSAFVSEGWCFDERGNLTEAGLDLAAENDVPLRELHILTLGTELTLPHDGGKLHIKAGSQLQVIFGGYNKRHHAKYWDCIAGDELPPLRVYQSRSHSFMTVRWPVNLPVRGNYLPDHKLEA